MSVKMPRLVFGFSFQNTSTEILISTDEWFSNLNLPENHLRLVKTQIVVT